MKVKAGVFVAVLGLIAAAVPVLAHHSFAAEYEANKPITITGTVTRLEWMNPHARFYVEVKETDGKTALWNFELGAIPVLLKQGWRKDSLKLVIKSPSRAPGRGTAPQPQTPEASSCPMAGESLEDHQAATPHRTRNRRQHRSSEREE